MKNYLKFLLSVLIAITAFIGCEKNAENQNNMLDSHEGLDKSEQNFVPVGVNCTVPTGYTSCYSTCLFSDCCVVWDPKKETGGCSCFFGVARCKTQAIEVPNKTSSLVSSTSQRSIVFHTDKFGDFLSYCKEYSIDISKIENSFTKNILQYKLDEHKSIKIEPSSFDQFLAEYEYFINNLQPGQLEIINNYLN